MLLYKKILFNWGVEELKHQIPRYSQRQSVHIKKEPVKIITSTGPSDTPNIQIAACPDSAVEITQNYSKMTPLMLEGLVEEFHQFLHSIFKKQQNL